MGKLIKLIPHIQWLNGFIVKIPKDQANLLHVYAPSLTAIEELAAFRNVYGTVTCWRLDEHLDRLQNTIKLLDLKVNLDINAIKQGINSLIEQANQDELYIQVVITPKNEVDFDQHILIDKYVYGPIIKNLTISSYPRGYPQFQMQINSWANKYWRVADEELLLDQFGYVTGTPTENLYIIKNRIALTPPNNGSILPGFTRQLVSEILSNPTVMYSNYNNTVIPVVEKNITLSDLLLADEVFLTSTKNGIVVVSTINGRKISKNSITKLLMEIYYKVVKGQIKL